MAKSFVVLALSGGVFFHYFGGLRRTETTLSGSGRLMAAISAAVVVVMLVLGFLQLGTPGEQRELRADNLRVQQLYRLGSAIGNYWKSHNSKLPTDLSQLPGLEVNDPITDARYEYKPEQGSHYQLCAMFVQSSSASTYGAEPNAWFHPAGHYCFKLDATALLQYPYYPAE